jgi:hypothetical protein
LLSQLHEWQCVEHRQLAGGMPGRRRRAAATAWMIVPVGFGLFLLTGRLASR